MVTLIQQQQTPDDSHQCQREEQKCADGAVASAKNHAVDFHGVEEEEVEVVRRAKETALVVPGNDSVGGSSTQCSDIDDDDIVDDEDEEEEEEEEEETDVEEGGGGGWVANLPMPPTAIIQQHQAVATANGNVVLPNADPSNFGDVCVKNSTNVHLGNKTFYKGPVTIKQFVYTNPALVQDENNLEAASHAADANVSDLPANKVDVGADRPILQQNNELYKVTQWLWTWRCAALLCILALILVTTVVVCSLYLTRRADAPSAPVFPEIPDSSLEGVAVYSVRFVGRNEWGAQPPSEPLTKLKLPVPYVIISHTATDFCSTQSECTFHVRFAQTFHIESRKWSDIGYNFLVGGDGLAYVGRSWDYIGAHSFGYNNRSIGISFIGTFNSVIPPKVQLHAAQKLIEIGVKGGKIAPDYKLLGHRQISKTLSPGDALYSILKTWPHWVPSP